MNCKPILTILIFVILCSCERKRGCLDEQASNFDRSAKKADICLYEGQVAFWIDSDKLGTYKNEKVDLYVNHELIFNDTVVRVHPKGTGEPGCDAATALKVARSLGENTRVSLSYRIVSANSKVLADSTVTFEGGFCVPHQMDFR